MSDEKRPWEDDTPINPRAFGKREPMPRPIYETPKAEQVAESALASEFAKVRHHDERGEPLEPGCGEYSPATGVRAGHRGQVDKEGGSAETSLPH